MQTLTGRRRCQVRVRCSDRCAVWWRDCTRQRRRTSCRRLRCSGTAGSRHCETRRRFDEVTYSRRQLATRYHVNPDLSTDSTAFQTSTQFQLSAVQGEPAAILLNCLDSKGRQPGHINVGPRLLGNSRRCRGRRKGAVEVWAQSGNSEFGVQVMYWRRRHECSRGPWRWTSSKR